MTAWLNRKMRIITLDNYEPVTEKNSLRIICILLGLSAIGLLLKQFVPLPVLIKGGHDPIATQWEFVYAVVVAPIIEELSGRGVLLYCTLMLIQSDKENRAHLQHRMALLAVGIIVGVMVNHHLIKDLGTSVQLIKHTAYIMFLAPIVLLFGIWEKGRSILFFILLIGSSLFFAWIHENQLLFPVYFAFAVLNSSIAVKTRSILLPIGIHAYLNLFSVLVILFT